MNQPARILVVEDSADNRQLLCIYLSREGYQIVEAVDGAQALEKALAEPFDLICSDVQMPRLDGYSLCRCLKENAATEHIPVILITAVHTALQDTLEGLQIGANDFISRPFRQSELLARVKTQLRIKDLQDRLVQAERVATIGRMAVTMAHEINNPLVGILGYVELLADRLAQGSVEEDLRLLLPRIQQNARQIRDVLNRLRDIHHPDIYTYAEGMEAFTLNPPAESEPGDAEATP